MDGATCGEKIHNMYLSTAKLKTANIILSYLCAINYMHLLTPQEQILRLTTNNASQRDAFQCNYLRYVHVGRVIPGIIVVCVIWRKIEKTPG